MNEKYEIALFALQRITCLFSAVGSLMIISQVTRSSFNRAKPQQRLVLGISISDFFSSTVWVFTPLFMPPDSGMIWATGNMTTCNVQGFMVTLFVAAGVLYQCMLQLQYLLVIKYSWSQRRLRNIERYLHAFPWSCGLASAITNLVLKNYNPANWDCWIAPLPGDCTSSFEIRQGNSDLTETDCIRGDNANIYQWLFFFGPLWVCGVFCLFAMFQVYTSVYKAENRTRGSRLSMNTELRMTMEVKHQSMTYALAFFAIWTIPTIVRLIQLCGGSVHPITVVLAGTFIGTQGIWNAIIYFKPRYRKFDDDLNGCQKVLSLINSTLFFWVRRHEKIHVDDHNDCVDVAEDVDGNAIGLRDGETDSDIIHSTHEGLRRSTTMIEDSFTEMKSKLRNSGLINRRSTVC